MYSYHMLEWVFYFYLYSFFGWCFESVYVSLRKKHPVNRGFMRGPFLPLYGSGAVMMLAVSMPFRDNLFLTYLAGCLGATALEYVTGVMMEYLFKVRYWDYSSQRFNFQGHICLSSTIVWGFFTIFMTRYLHRPVEVFTQALPQTVLFLVVMLITVVGVMDFSLSFKAAMDVRDILVKLEAAREELERMQKRLDVMIALADEARESKKQERSMKAEELVNGIEERLEFLKERLQKTSDGYLETVREEIGELRVKFGIQKEHRIQLKSLRDFYKRRMLLDNPGMVSCRFKETLEELREAAGKWSKKDR